LLNNNDDQSVSDEDQLASTFKTNDELEMQSENVSYKRHFKQQTK